MDLKESEILGTHIQQHWYYQAKAAAMMKLLGGTQILEILDIGAGSGFFSRWLLSHSNATNACCLDSYYTSDSDEVISGKPIRFRRQITRTDADLILMMDVLEHVADDYNLLLDYVELANSGTRFLITVPAFQWLWSAHDDFLLHKRRYTLRSLTKIVKKSGLKIDIGIYYFAMVLPIAAGLRLIEHMLPVRFREPRSQLQQHHPLTNKVLSGLCGMELSFMKFNRYGGLSIFCLATKT